jgi:3-oxoacyl-[acyl-carrier-protein] synthase-3
MESYLGMVNGKPSLARRIVLSKNGIKSRYYALDKEGHVTHTSVQMAANAIHGLEDEHFSIDDADVLAYGTASPEYVMPSPGVMVHGELGGKNNMEVVSFQGSCCTSMQALKYAWMSIQSGVASNVICAASERMSAWMNSNYFKVEAENIEKLQKRPILAFEKEFLRWMLSDGAAALLLRDKPSAEGLSLKVEWVELCSYANEKETCMYAGGDKREDGQVDGWAMFSGEDWLKKSIFALKQDTRELGANIVELGGEFLRKIAKKHNMKSEDIDWLLPHLSSMFFREQIKTKLDAIGLPIGDEHWFINLPRIGNVAAVSALAMVDDIFHSGKLQKGQHLLMMIPESARFSYGYAFLTVC